MTVERETVLAADPVLREIVARLVAELEPRRIYLFGSQARGNVGPDSDYDLMVLVDEAAEPLYRLSQRGHLALWGLGLAADIVVWDRAMFDSRVHLAASFAGTVVREGKLLYAA